MSRGTRLFVYGSLRTGSGHAMNERLARCACCLGPASVNGTLHAVSWYPGLVLGGAGRVVGELWELDSASQWEWLDHYEGCGANAPRPHEFRPRDADVLTDIGPSTAVVYVYQRTPPAHSLVESGDWLARG